MGMEMMTRGVGDDKRNDSGSRTPDDKRNWCS
jgi:hypothetical protein